MESAELRSQFYDKFKQFEIAKIRFNELSNEINKLIVDIEKLDSKKNENPQSS